MGLRFAFLILISPLFTTAIAKSGDAAPLVYLYCDYLLSKTPTVQDVDASWAELVRQFESRPVLTKINENALSPKFQDCVERNRSLFETGEFILDGRERVSELMEEVKKARPARPELMNVSFSYKDRELSTPEFQIYLEEDTENIATDDPKDNRILKDLELRKNTYDREWTEFLDALQYKTKNSIVVISLTKE